VRKYTPYFIDRGVDRYLLFDLDMHHSFLSILERQHLAGIVPVGRLQRRPVQRSTFDVNFHAKRLPSPG